MPESDARSNGSAGEKLPVRTPLTLAEVVSWLAWGCAFPCEDFRLAGGRDWLREKIAWLEVAGRTGDELTEARGELSRSEAKRAEMKQAAGGAGYDSEAFADGLGKAAARLFDAVRARRLAARAKRCDQDAGWTPIPEEWLWIDPTDPRPPIAILDVDRMTREGNTPLWQIVGSRSHDPERAADWFAVRFEREEVLRAFLPSTAQPGQDTAEQRVMEPPERPSTVLSNLKLLGAEYILRVEQWKVARAANPRLIPPSEKADHAWAKSRFGRVARTAVRSLRAKHAPPCWRKAGKRVGEIWRE